MKKLKLAVIFLIIATYPLVAQQDPLTSQYMFNTLTYNPGVAGVSGMICATAINRQQWVGFKGAPSTTVFNISAPVKPFKIKSGVGLLVEMAVTKGRSTKPKLKIGICGEHGGEPSSVEFCDTTGLDYVSCSPFRVPIARLAAAQANVKHNA